MTDATAERPRNFIEEIIDADIEAGKHAGKVCTRFPPEPNGYLHIGHAKSICLNYGLAQQYGGSFNLRFDDTNPAKEEDEFVKAITDDVRWLGADWDELCFASDYFGRMYELAVQLIKDEKAYVCDLTPEETREYRGTLTEPGRPSPGRSRTVDENLDLFDRMRSGEFEEGSRTLRARIDMASPNMNLRDPVMYRVVNKSHHRTGDAWHIYPTYDWAHGLEDSFEGITHSICTLEFENHRPLYDWYLEQLGVHHPQQIEFAKLKLSYVVMQKRNLRMLVEEGYVNGWDDPRMPTLRGMRRRGYPPSAIRAFCDEIGVTKFDGVIEFERLENAIRADMNKTAPRVMAVLDPIKVVIENYPDGQTEELEAVNNPEDEAAGTRNVPFGKTLYIERDDFMEDPPKKFFRLGPGREVRLRYAYFVTCTGVEKDADGNITEIRCTYDPATRGGNAPDGRKVKGTIHWVSAEHALGAEVRLFDRLFTKENPTDPRDEKPFTAYLNDDSLVVKRGKLEPSLASANELDRFQFERLGYFCVDADSASDALVFNRTVALRDSWAKIQKKL